MERTETLKVDPPGAGAFPATCPRCGEPHGSLPGVPSAILGGRPVSRCTRCGTRSAPSSETRAMVFTCESCGLPFLAGDILPHGEQRCGDCSSGTPPADLPDAAVAAASESEIRVALSGRWHLVTHPPLAAYLDRIARSVAQKIEGAPSGARCVLVNEPGIKTLALPSGALLVTLDTLAFLEDEAELAFVLGHELAHSASEDAAVRLVQLGFRAVSRGGPAPDREAWGGAALDLVRLGYGRRRERDADLRALEAMLALGYDPRSVLRYLGRVRSAIDTGDSAVAELASAHPPAEDRARRLEKALFGRVRDDSVFRVNREVFRRAAGREALAGPMTPVGFGGESPKIEVGTRRSRRALWIGIGVAAAVAVASIAAYVLLVAVR